MAISWGVKRGIYSNEIFDAMEVIRQEVAMERLREAAIRERIERESLESTDEAFLEELEAQHPFNCEHVVPQSWFNKRKQPKTDLHHLFTCESKCNSFRSNHAYFDFDAEGLPTFVRDVDVVDLEILARVVEYCDPLEGFAQIERRPAVDIRRLERGRKRIACRRRNRDLLGADAVAAGVRENDCVGTCITRGEAIRAVDQQRRVDDIDRDRILSVVTSRGRDRDRAIGRIAARRQRRCDDAILVGNDLRAENEAAGVRGEQHWNAFHDVVVLVAHEGRDCRVLGAIRLDRRP